MNLWFYEWMAGLLSLLSLKDNVAFTFLMITNIFLAFLLNIIENKEKKQWQTKS